MEKNKILKCLIVIAAIAVTGVIVAVLAFSSNPARRLSKLLDLGNRYLEACEYEQAIAAYDEALAIDPKNVEALDKMAECYLEWASTEAEQNGIDSAVTILEEGYQKTKDTRLQEQLEEIRTAVVNTEESGSTNTSRDQETIVQESSEPYEDYRDLCEAIIAIGDTPVLGKPMKDWTYEVEAAYIRTNSTPTDTFEDGSFQGITAEGNPTYISDVVAQVYFGEPYSKNKEIARTFRSYEIRSSDDLTELYAFTYEEGFIFDSAYLPIGSDIGNFLSDHGHPELTQWITDHGEEEPQLLGDGSKQWLKTIPLSNGWELLLLGFEGHDANICLCTKENRNGYAYSYTLCSRDSLIQQYYIHENP